IVLERTGCPEAGATFRCGLNRLHQPLGDVPVNQGAPRHDVIDVAVAVDIFDGGSRRPLDEDWCAAYRRERADGAVHTAGKHIKCPGKKPLGFRRSLHWCIRAPQGRKWKSLKVEQWKSKS